MKSENQMVTGKVRLSFVHAFAPYASSAEAEPKYGVTLLIPKSDQATLRRIEAAIAAAKQMGLAGIFNGALPPILALPIHDGDGPRVSDGTPYGEECKGCYVMTASSKIAPGIVDSALNPILSQTEIYSGIYARVSIQLFPYSKSGKKGIGCGLGNIQKLEDGEPLGSRTTPEADFGGEEIPAWVTSQNIDPITGRPVK